MFQRGLEVPAISVWQDGVRRLYDDVPGKLFGLPHISKTKMHKVLDSDKQIQFLLRHTFWGHKLCSWSRSDKTERRDWAKFLIKRLRALLDGGPDPNWTTRHFNRLFGNNYEYPTQDRKDRTIRFYELLKTVDGIFMQRFLSFPEERWTWERFDMFTLGNLSHLIGDEFIPPVLTRHTYEYLKSHPLRYKELKSMRKELKFCLNQDKVPETMGFICKDRPNPKWLDFFNLLYERVKILPPGIIREYITGQLSQTRGAGTPPHAFSNQSLVKLVETMTEKVEPFPEFSAKLLEKGLDSLRRELTTDLSFIFTGLEHHGSVNLSNSASFEKKRKEGGTIEAISEYCLGMQFGIPVEMFDLNTGESRGMHRYCDSRIKSDYPEIGMTDYIFWRSLQEIRKTSMEDLRTLRASMVEEPSKTRSVTIGMSALKVVLDVVNGICSHPLKKYPSSISGMSKANHSWNTFLDFFKPEHRDLFFKERENSGRPGTASNRTIREYETVYALSTDYTEATDSFRFDVAKRLGVFWMQLCGIPTALINIVIQVSFGPRKLIFNAPKGSLLKEYGEVIDNDHNFVWTTKGLPMGDPLTKVILHLYNIVVRKSARSVEETYREVYGAEIPKNPYLATFSIRGKRR